MKFFRKNNPGRARIKITPPQSASHRSNLAICAIMKDEERHIQDWIGFHSLAGVKDFLLYDNGSTDNTVALAKRFTSLNIYVVPWKFDGVAKSGKCALALSPQSMSYCHAIANFGSQYRWMAFIDIDEILVPKKCNSLEEALAPLDQESNISLPWTMFGPNGHVSPPNRTQFYAYTARAKTHPSVLLNFKCIVDPCKVTEVGIHKFGTLDLGLFSSNDTGVIQPHKKRYEDSFVSRANIQLNHYYTRSHKEIEEKLSKGDACGFPRSQREPKVWEKVELINKALVQDDSALQFLGRVGIASDESFRLYVKKLSSDVP